jgi:hypothetical protein
VAGRAGTRHPSASADRPAAAFSLLASTRLSPAKAAAACCAVTVTGVLVVVTTRRAAVAGRDGAAAIASRPLAADAADITNAVNAALPGSC